MSDPSDPLSTSGATMPNPAVCAEAKAAYNAEVPSSHFSNERTGELIWSEEK